MKRALLVCLLVTLSASEVVLPAVATAGPPEPGAPSRTGGTFSWQEAYARVLPHGDLEWTPKPFRFDKGASPRYIDFDGGNDENDGTTSQAPWKHHPWDSRATGKARACRGIHTYVFKGGVDYRGELTVREAGRPGDLIRLTRDPGWGRGPAVLCGSERVTGWTKGATHKDIPEPEKVWWADPNFAPRSVWLVCTEGDFLRIPLARTPNWKRSNPDDVTEQGAGNASDCRLARLTLHEQTLWNRR